MTSKRRPSLLEDLASLLVKHGPEPFEELATRLGDPAFTVQLSRVLADLAKASRSVAVPPPATSSKNHGNSDSPPLEQQERSKLLKSIRTRIGDSRYFPRLADLREFADRVGFHAPADASRERFTKEFSKDLGGRDAKELASILKSVALPRERNALSEWSDLIISKPERR